MIAVGESRTQFKGFVINRRCGNLSLCNIQVTAQAIYSGRFGK